MEQNLFSKTAYVRGNFLMYTEISAIAHLSC